MAEIYIPKNRLWEFMDLLKECIHSLLYLLVSVVKLESSKTVTPLHDILYSERINEQAGRLMTSYGNSVLRLAYSYLHNMSDAEDVLQDTLIQFIKTQPRFETAEHEKAWFLRVAINISKNKITSGCVNTQPFHPLNFDLCSF